MYYQVKKLLQLLSLKCEIKSSYLKKKMKGLKMHIKTKETFPNMFKKLSFHFFKFIKK